MRRSMLVALLGVAVISGCGEGGRDAAEGPPPLVQVEPDEVQVAQLRAAVTDPQLRRFYDARGWQPAWTEEQTRAFAAALAQAGSHALDRSLFWEDLPGNASPAQKEAALTFAAIRYAGALSNGAVDPKSLFEVYTVPANRADPSAGLQQALAQNSVGQWFAGLPPQDAEYRALMDAYARMRARAQREGPLTIPQGETIERGARDPRVPAIVESLRRNGYLPPAPAGAETGGEAPPQSNSNSYTPELAGAVARLQEEQGIEPDGIVGAETTEALNLGARERALMLAVNLERRRWLERRPVTTRIDVNTAGAFLDYWRDGGHVQRARVVVGQPGWETPELGSPLRNLVANPPWRVPESIAEAEILPKGAGYMRENNMRFENGRIVQAPGPESALGLVKFDLANPHAIYLHDTPSKALFAKSDRHASHGCARVHNALAFARLIADDQGKREEFERALASGEEGFVQLPRPVPVRFLYHTVHVEGGRLVFRHDDYGWDQRVAAALRLEARRNGVARSYATDVGP